MSKIMLLVNSLLNKQSIVILICLFFTACYSVKQKGGKYHPSDYESFFLGEGKSQYFIQPVKLKNKNYSFEIDFTFRDIDFSDSNAVANFTITSEDRLIKIDSLIIISQNSPIKAKNINVLYHHQDKNEHILRCTSLIVGKQLSEYFKSNSIQINAFSNGKRLLFESDKKLNKKRNRINHNLIESLLNEENY